MTPRQAELARHALGVLRRTRGWTSPQRNEACPTGSEIAEWEEMVASGYACKTVLTRDGRAVYRVLDAGREKALAGIEWPRSGRYAQHAGFGRGTPLLLLILALLPSPALAIDCPSVSDTACAEDVTRLEAGLLMERSVCRAQREDLAALAAKREGAAKDEGRRAWWRGLGWGVGGGVLATLVAWLTMGVW